ncbi:sugar kinase [Spirochaetia bacterium]|nr:sugar kinase [Spirochaetia bacterium]
MMNDSGFVMGIDVGSTKVLVGYVDRRGRILAKRRFAMDRKDTSTTLNSIYGAIESFLTGEGGKPLAAGLGLVGRCDPSTGRWERAFNLPIPMPVDIAGEIRRRFGLECWIDNDVFCAALAEISFGAGKKYRDFLLLNVGTGLSAGIVAEGRLLRGAGNAAGEVGQWRCPGTGEKGRALTLEQVCSGGGMIERARRMMAQEKSSLAALAEGDLHSLSIYEAAQAGDALGKRIIDDALRGLCEALCALAAVFNPAAVVLAGSVACTPGFAGEIDRYVRANAYPGCLPDLKEIYLSALDAREVGLIGAAAAGWNGLPEGGEKKEGQENA